MSDWESDHNSSQHPSREESQQSANTNSTGEVGLYDVVEAFTALRQQWRTQSRENRELAQSVESAAEKLASVDQLLHELVLRTKQDSSSISAAENQLPLIRCVVEMDSMVRRAVQALEQARAKSKAQSREESGQIESRQVSQGSGLQSQVDTVAEQVDRVLRKQSWWRRFFCRSFAFALLNEFSAASTSTKVQDAPKKSAAEVEGMRLLLGRMERMLKEQGIERLDTLGLPFDGQIMLAIDAVRLDELEDVAGEDLERFQRQGSGVVIHEYAPAYRWNDKIVRIAEVRVAR